MPRSVDRSEYVTPSAKKYTYWTKTHPGPPEGGVGESTEEVDVSVLVLPGGDRMFHRDYRAYGSGKVANRKQVRKTLGYLPTTGASDSILRLWSDVSTYSFIRGQDVAYPGRVESLYENCPVLGTPPAYSGFPYHVMMDCHTKLISRVSDADFNIGMFLGEGKSTIEQVLGFAKRYNKALTQFKRGKFSAAAKTLGITTPKGAANNWLEWQYGWSPLLNDARAAAEYTVRRVIDLSTRVKRQARRVVTEDITGPAGSAQHPIQPAKWFGTRTLTAREWVICEIENPTIRAAAEAGLTNPLALAWEATPFSFVADWFVGVGDYLSTISAFHGLNILDAGWSYRVVQEGSYHDAYDPRVQSNATVSRFYQLEYRRFGGLWQPSLRAALLPSVEALDSFAHSLSRLSSTAALIRSNSASLDKLHATWKL